MLRLDECPWGVDEVEKWGVWSLSLSDSPVKGTLQVGACVVCDVVWCGVVWCAVVWCGVVWFGVVWWGVV